MYVILLVSVCNCLLAYLGRLVDKIQIVSVYKVLQDQVHEVEDRDQRSDHAKSAGDEEYQKHPSIAGDTDMVVQYCHSIFLFQ